MRPTPGYLIARLDGSPPHFAIPLLQALGLEGTSVADLAERLGGSLADFFVEVSTPDRRPCDTCGKKPPLGETR